MKAHHDIKNLRFSGEFMILTVDGNEKTFNLKDISHALERASEKERNTYKISPSGYGIHWPLLDEDISIDGLLGVTHTKSIKRKSA